MNKFSIVVPTMWKFSPFCDFVESLTQMELIGEVIVINNNVAATPTHSILTHPKIRLCNQQYNIGVNPAWNLGVLSSQFPNICIMNDDIIFDLSVFFRVNEVLTPGKLFVTDVKRFEDKTPYSNLLEIKPITTTEKLFHFGCLMFLSKSDWIPIPNSLRIFYGDNWIWDVMRNRYGQTYSISQLKLYTPGSSTCNLFPNKEMILQQEAAEYHRLFPTTLTVK